MTDSFQNIQQSYQHLSFHVINLQSIWTKVYNPNIKFQLSKKVFFFFKYILFSLNGWKQKLEGQAVNQNYSADLPYISHNM